MQVIRTMRLAVNYIIIVYCTKVVAVVLTWNKRRVRVWIQFLKIVRVWGRTDDRVREL